MRLSSNIVLLYSINGTSQDLGLLPVKTNHGMYTKAKPAFQKSENSNECWNFTNAEGFMSASPNKVKIPFGYVITVFSGV